jgi:hypothetical protein
LRSANKLSALTVTIASLLTGEAESTGGAAAVAGTGGAAEGATAGATLALNKETRLRRAMPVVGSLK